MVLPLVLDLTLLKQRGGTYLNSNNHRLEKKCNHSHGNSFKIPDLKYFTTRHVKKILKRKIYEFSRHGRRLGSLNFTRHPLWNQFCDVENILTGRNLKIFVFGTLKYLGALGICKLRFFEVTWVQKQSYNLLGCITYWKTSKDLGNWIYILVKNERGGVSWWWKFRNLTKKRFKSG